MLSEKKNGANRFLGNLWLFSSNHVHWSHCICGLSEEAIQIFSKDPQVLEIGNVAFRLIGSSFLPAALSLTIPVFFQAIGKGKESITVTVLREVFTCAVGMDIFAFRIELFLAHISCDRVDCRCCRLGNVPKNFQINGQVFMRPVNGILNWVLSRMLCPGFTSRGLKN